VLGYYPTDIMENNTQTAPTYFIICPECGKSVFVQKTILSTTVVTVTPVTYTGPTTANTDPF
jgi:hypothetical protein